MSTVIKIKNTNLDKAPVDSGTGDSLIATGELAYSYATGAQNNDGDRLYIGIGTETSGLSDEVVVIGGQYFTDMLDHVHGTLTASSAVIVDSSSKIDQWNVDNLVMNGNTISVDQSSDTNGNIIIAPGGTGDEVILTAGTITINGVIDQTGNQQITGNLDVTGNATVSGTFDVTGQTELASLNVEDLTNDRIVIAGADGEIEDDANFTFDGTTFQVHSSGKFTVDVATGNTYALGTFEVDGQSTLASAAVEDLTNNRIVIAGTSGELEDDAEFTFDGTTFKVGTSTNDKFRVSVANGNVATTGSIQSDSTLSITGTSTLTGLVTASNGIQDSTLTAGRVTFAGASGRLVDDGNFTFDSATDKLDITGSLEVDNILFDANKISTTTGDLEVAPASQGTVNFSNNSAIKLPVGTTLNRPTGALGHVRYNTTTSQYEGYNGSDWQGLGGVIDNDRNTYIVTDDNMGGLSVPASPASDTLYFVTGGVHVATLDATNGLVVDVSDGSSSLKLNNSTLSTASGDLYLDPGATGDGTGGNVVVYGNLQVQGTTTTVNSTTVTIDDPVFTLGGDSTPTADDNLDRGIEFKWHNGSAAKVGFFGWDDSASRFTFIDDATNSSEVFAGDAGDVEFGNALLDSITFSSGNYTATSIPYVDGSGDVQFLQETSTDYGTEGQILQMNSSGVPFFGHIDCGTY